MDFKWYLYLLRPLRASSFFMALTYSFFYWLDVAIAIDMIYIQDYWQDNDNQTIPDFMLASMASYSSVHFAFTEFF